MKNSYQFYRNFWITNAKAARHQIRYGKTHLDWTARLARARQNLADLRRDHAAGVIA